MTGWWYIGSILVDTGHFTGGIWKNPLRTGSGSGIENLNWLAWGGFQFKIHFRAKGIFPKAHMWRVGYLINQLTNKPSMIQCIWSPRSDRLIDCLDGTKHSWIIVVFILKQEIKLALNTIQNKTKYLIINYFISLL